MRYRDHIRQTDERSSFHTFELKTVLHDDAEFKLILKRLKSLSKRQEFYLLSEYGGNTYFCGHFSKHGIRIYLTQFKQWNIVKLVINPRLLIDPNATYLGIMLPDKKHLDQMELNFTKYIQKIGLPDSIDDWKLTRIDLCTNFLYDRKKLPRQIIQLISRGPVAPGYTLSKYSATSPDEIEKHSIKFESKRISLVAYDKNYQAKRENLALPSEMITRGILRLELQCHLDWIYEKSTKHGCTTTREQIDFFSSHSGEYLRKYSQKLLLTGEYCQPAILKDRIQEATGISRKVKKRMTDFVDILSENNVSFDAGAKKIARNCTDDQLRTMFEQFNRLNICPVPLDKHCKLKTIQSIPSILEMMGDSGLDIRHPTGKKEYQKRVFKACCE